MASTRFRAASAKRSLFTKLTRRPRLGVETLEDRTVPSGGDPVGIVPLNPNGTARFQPGPDLTMSQTEVMAYVRGEDPGAVISSLATRSDGMGQAIDLATTKVIFDSGDRGLVRVGMDLGTEQWDLIQWMERQSGVMWSSPNYMVSANAADFTPNDTDYPLQYSHTKMQTNLAWDLFLGSSNIIVAVTDNEIAVAHPDLKGNIWINPGEIAANGKDDDGNGFVDDINGYNFAQNQGDPSPDAGDLSHGTHVSGIIAARTNNGEGVAGVAGGNNTSKGAQIMGLRWDVPSWTAANVAGSFTYAADNGAKIVNSSYNFDFFTDSSGNVDPTVVAGWDYSYSKGVLHFLSAGNNGELDPARRVIVNGLFVAASDQQDVKADFSNYGEFTDITAPGFEVRATLFDDSVAGSPFVYADLSGTSMSAPNAAGVAALIWGFHPTWTREQVVAHMLGTADNIDGPNPSFIGALGTGRANPFRALTESIDAPKFGGTPGLPAEGSTVQVLTTFKIITPQRFDPATVNLANFDLRGSGVDKTFDTADDVIIPLVINDGAEYRVGTNALVFKFSALPDDAYRFTAKSGGLTDPFGQLFDGNGDGIASTDDHFVRTWNARPQISGRVFEDWNANGTFEVGEPGLPGATVYIDTNQNGKQDPSEKFATTGPGGTFAFGGLANGTYSLRQSLAPGYAETSPPGGKYVVTLSAADPTESGLLFGTVRQSAIYGTVFDDTVDMNGVQNPSDPGLPNWRVFIDADGNGRYDVPTKTTAATLQTKTSVPINDVSTVKSTAVLLGQPGAIKDVNVTLNITHTWDSDLSAFLIAPDGTRVLLFNGVGGSGDNFINTIFDDQAAVSIFFGNAPFAGKFRPQQKLSTFNGLSAVGQWTLEVNDNVAGDSGILGSWQIDFQLANGDLLSITDGFGHYRFDAGSTGVQRVRLEPQAGWFTISPTTIGYDLTVPVGTTLTSKDFAQVSDNVGPAVASITRLDPDPAFGTQVRFLVTFNEPISGLTANNLLLIPGGSVTGVSLAGILALGAANGYAANYQVTANTGTGDGTLGLNFAAGTGIADRAQNPFGGSLPFVGQEYTVYKSPAVFSITSSPDPTNATTVDYIVELSTPPVSPLLSTDFTAVAGGGVTFVGVGVPTADGSGKFWTVPVLGVSGDGTLRLDLNKTSTIVNSPATGSTIVIDQRHPNITSLSMLDATPTKAASVRYQATFDEDVFGLTAANFTVVVTGDTTGATVTNISGSGTSYTITVSTGTGNGSVELEYSNSTNFHDLAGNPIDGFPLRGGAYTVITVPPIVTTMTRLDPPVTGSPNVRYEVVFSSVVTGVLPTSFFLESTVGSAFIVAVTPGPSGFHDTYIVTVNTGSTNGFVGLNLVDPDGVVDIVGNLVQVPYIGPVYTIVKEAPSVLNLVPLDPNPTNAATVSYRLIFSEPVTGLDVTDFGLDSAGLTNVALMSIVGTGDTYTITISTGTGDGTFRLNLIDDDTILNSASNPLGGTGNSNGSVIGPLYTVDRTGPTVGVGLAGGQTASAIAGPVRFSVLFSDSVTGFNAGHVIVGGTAAFGSVSVSGFGNSYVVTVDGIVGTGDVSLSVPAAVVTDAVGNPNSASTAATVTITGAPPPPTPTKRAPIGFPDTYTLGSFGTFRASAAAGVLANDVNPDGRPVTATLLSSVDSRAGSLTFNSDGSFSFLAFPGFSGATTFTYAATDPLLQSDPVTVTLNVPFIQRVELTAVSAGAGAGPQVSVYNPDNSLRFSFFAYPADINGDVFKGGVTVATGDVNGDGVDDIITAPFSLGGPVVRVFDGLTGTNIYNFLAYAADFRGGVYLAAGDVDGDGLADIMTGAGNGGGPHVQVLRGGDFVQIRNFFAYDPEFRGGVTVAAGDLTGDGLADLITSPAVGGGPHVKVFDAVNGFVRLSFFAYDPSFSGGLNVATGDVTGDGRHELLVATGQGGTVRVFDTQGGSLIRQFEPSSLNFAGGARIAVKDGDSDGDGDTLILATGPGGSPEIVRYALPGINLINSISDFPSDFHGGLFIG